MASDNKRSNRPIVKEFKKSAKQKAYDGWNEAKRVVKVQLNEMVNTVPAVMAEIRDELVNTVLEEVNEISNAVDLQEISYSCNKGYRMYIEYKYSSPAVKKEKKKEIQKWMRSLPKRLYNGFILFIVKDVFEQSINCFSMLWDSGAEMWKEFAIHFEALKDLFADATNDNKESDKNDKLVQKILKVIEKLLPLIIALTSLILNYLENHKQVQTSASAKLSSFKAESARGLGINDYQQQEKPNESTSSIYKDSVNPEGFNLKIGDSKLYPQEVSDPYADAMKNLNSSCNIEPSQIMRLIYEDQEKVISPEFINATDSKSEYSEEQKNQAESLCYLIPPANQKAGNLLSGDADDSNNDNDVSGNDCIRAIIEFDDDCCAYPAEPYSLSCFPGQSVKQDTLLGYCLQQGQMLPIKSIFESGVVRKDLITGDFGRIRPERCNRHFIIDCIEDGTDGILDSSLVENLVTDFTQEQDIFKLLSEYMYLATLPNIILNKKYYEEPKKMVGIVINPKWIENNGIPDARKEVYKDFIEHCEDTFENFQKDIKKTFNEDKIKGTDGDYDKLNGIANETLDQRKEYLFGKHQWGAKKNGIWELWELSKDQDKTKCYKEYDDCRDLGNTYYIDLLAGLQFTEEEPNMLDYYNLLERILIRRRNVEGLDYGKIQARVSSGLSKISKKIHLSDLDKAYDGPDKFSSIIGALSTDLNTSNSSIYKTLYEVSNLYMFLRRNSSTSNNAKKPSDSYMLDLVQSEREELDRFFKEKRNKYDSVNIDSLIERTKNLKPSQAEWPVPIDIVIGKTNYRLYRFSNVSAYYNSIVQGSDNSLDASEISPESYGGYDEPSDNDIKKQLGDLLADSRAAEESLNDNNGIPEDANDKFSYATDVPITELKYWKKYCGLATVTTIPFLATGLVILGVPIPLPAIYIPMVVIKGDVLLVVGLGIRGISIFPMLIYVNTSQDNASALVPIMLALKAVKDQFMKQINKIEMSVPDLVDLQIEQLEKNNAALLQQNTDIDRSIAKLKSLQKPKWSKVAKEAKSMLGQSTRQDCIRLPGK